MGKILDSTAKNVCEISNCITNDCTDIIT